MQQMWSAWRSAALFIGTLLPAVGMVCWGLLGIRFPVLVEAEWRDGSIHVVEQELDLSGATVVMHYAGGGEWSIVPSETERAPKIWRAQIEQRAGAWRPVEAPPVAEPVEVRVMLAQDQRLWDYLISGAWL